MSQTEEKLRETSEVSAVKLLRSAYVLQSWRSECVSFKNKYSVTMIRKSKTAQIKVDLKDSSFKECLHLSFNRMIMTLTTFKWGSFERLTDILEVHDNAWWDVYDDVDILLLSAT